jgi:hypothetical protein
MRRCFGLTPDLGFQTWVLLAARPGPGEAEPDGLAVGPCDDKEHLPQRSL